MSDYAELRRALRDSDQYLRDAGAIHANDPTLPGQACEAIEALTARVAELEGERDDLGAKLFDARADKCAAVARLAKAVEALGFIEGEAHLLRKAIIASDPAKELLIRVADIENNARKARTTLTDLEKADDKG